MAFETILDPRYRDGVPPLVEEQRVTGAGRADRKPMLQTGREGGCEPYKALLVALAAHA
jgi:hypothetical protein